MEKLEFKIGADVLNTLCSSDERMASLINKIGDYELELRTDYFPSLVRSIIGQQLSVGAARTIWQRMKTLCEDVTPEVIFPMGDQELKNVGISQTKVSYIKDLSQRVLNQEIDLNRFSSIPDIEVINQLLKVKGIGTWTAEMFLIFSLGRLDVLSVGDLGLKRAIQWLYGLKNYPAERTMRMYAKKWVPYRSVASLYLWEIINRGFIKESPGKIMELL